MKAPKQARIEVRELEDETLSAPPETITTTTDRPVSDETKRTIGTVLLRNLREASRSR